MWLIKLCSWRPFCPNWRVSGFTPCGAPATVCNLVLDCQGVSGNRKDRTQKAGTACPQLHWELHIKLLKIICPFDSWAQKHTLCTPKTEGIHLNNIFKTKRHFERNTYWFTIENLHTYPPPPPPTTAVQWIKWVFLRVKLNQHVLKVNLKLQISITKLKAMKCTNAICHHFLLLPLIRTVTNKKVISFKHSYLNLYALLYATVQVSMGSEEGGRGFLWLRDKLFQKNKFSFEEELHFLT